MSTTNTDYSWYWYLRKKGTRYYLGLVNQEGDAPASAYDIEIYYDQIPDELDDNDDLMPIPVQFELGLVKGVVAELMSMSNKDYYDLQLRNQYIVEYENTIREAIHHQIDASQQPSVIKPFDLRDDD